MMLWAINKILNITSEMKVVNRKDKFDLIDDLLWWFNCTRNNIIT